jgi:hypothetical protein
MVKVKLLITAIITLIGAIILAIFFSLVFQSAASAGIVDNEDLSFEEFLYWASPTKNSGDPMLLIIIMVYYVGVILFMFLSIGLKKIFITLGGIAIAVANFLILMSWLTGEMYEGVYKGACAINLVGFVLYLVGLIKFRSHYKAGLIFGPIMLAMAITVNLVFGFLYLNNIYDTKFNPIFMEQAINMDLLFQVIQACVIAVHSILFSFAKEGSDDSDDEELSIESESAFASYVPENMKKKKKKGKEKEEGVVFQL